MKTAEARRFFDAALGYVKKNHPKELRWVESISPKTFVKLDVRAFLEEYCWVLYCSGFNEGVVARKFGKMKQAYMNFDIDKLCGMKSPKRVLSVIGNKLKARCFLRGVKQIKDEVDAEGFEHYKARMKEDVEDVLQELPHIKGITWKHLARNIGLRAISKDDIHLRELAKCMNAGSVDELTAYLAKAVRKNKGVVDLILWRFCTKGGLKKDHC